MAALVVYNLNFQRIAAGDTVAASLVPFSLWLDGSVTADRFYPYLAEHAPNQTQGFHRKDGRAWSAYPIALPLLIAPLYAPAALVVRAGGWDTERIVLLSGVLEKLIASLVASLSVALFYLLTRRLTSPPRAVLAALVYAFATETWTISSQALWQHGGGELAVIAALLALVRLWEKPASRSALIAAGLAAGLAAALRPTNGLFVLALLGWLVAARRKPGELALAAAAPLVLGIATLGYNLHVFGRITGGYDAAFDAPFASGLAGLLVSPGRGLLVYTPVVLFSLLGLWAWWRDRARWSGPVWPVSATFALALILAAGQWRVWYGGHCYGPRLLTDALPCLVLLIVPALDWISRAVSLRIAFVLLLAWSTIAQAVGAFCYPSSRWDETPVAVGERPARLWDWRDNPIARSLAAGPRLGPDRTMLPKLKTLL